MISVPDAFASERVQQGGLEGARWVDALPDLVHRVARQWELDLADDVPRYGAHALVVLCARRGEPAALKIGWDKAEIAAEAAALQVWAGRGVVQLLAASLDDGALLLEGLDPTCTLDSLDLPSAAGVVGGLIRRLAVPAPGKFRYSDGWAGLGAHLGRQQNALGRPLPQVWVDLAAELAVELIASGGSMLLHTDLHSGNVLAGAGGEWVAIDPRVSVGDPERSAPDLLIWRLSVDASPTEVRDALGRMAVAGELRHDKVEQWAIVRAVGHWLWCTEENAKLASGAISCTTCGPRCSRILEALA